MRIDDVFEDHGDWFCVVELEEDVFVTVKYVSDSDYYYVMSCEDGYHVYNREGNTFDYNFNEYDVIEFAKKHKSTLS